MKLVTLLTRAAVCVALSVSALGSAQAATCIRPPANLAGWWSFEGNASDLLTGNVATVSGATYTAGEVGQALRFAAYLDGVDAGTRALPDDFTIGAWIYPTGSSIGGTVHSGPGPIAEYFDAVSFFQFPSSSDLHLALKDQTTGAVTVVTGTGGIVPNAWNFAAVTYSKASGVVKLYANGVLTATATVGSITLPSARAFYIGLRAPGAFGQAGTTYNGRLDEVQVFRRVLSATEIQDIKNAGAAGQCRAMRWQLDGNAENALGVNHGALLGGTFIQGKQAQALQLSAFLHGVKVPGLRIPTELTMDAWIFPTGSSIGGTVHPGPGPIAEFFGSVSLFQHPSITDVQLAIRDQTTGVVKTVTGFGGVVPNAWNHVAVTYARSSGTVSVYANGVLTGSGVLGALDLPALQDFYIGQRAPGAFGQSGTTYNGRLDEIRIFDRVMAATEIEALYQAASRAMSYSIVPLPSMTRIIGNGLSNSHQVVGGDGSTGFSWTNGGGLVNLGTLGGTETFPQGVSDSGQVVGFSSSASGFYRAFSWTPGGGMVDLGTLGTSGDSYAFGVNTSGQVVGYSSSTSGGYRAFSWTPGGGMVDIGALGSNTSHAYAVNDGGQVVGDSITASSSRHAFSWTPGGGMVDIGALDGRDATANLVNVSGQVAGSSITVGDETHSFSWTPGGGMVDIGTLGGNYSYQSALSDGGQVVGTSQTASGNPHAFVWTQAGGIVDLGTFGGIGSRANAVNASGQVVGTADRASGKAAFIWDASSGLVDLNDLIPTKPAGGWRAVEAVAIADDGAIVARSSSGFVLLLPGATNTAPVANAGPNQSIHAGSLVTLNGTASYDDNTPSVSLGYLWTFVSRPAGSAAVLASAATATPSFTADLPGTYSVKLVVNDGAGLQSSPSTVTISSDNLAPTADAGANQLAVVGQATQLDGTASVDPEGDPITYLWQLASPPAGSIAALSSPSGPSPYLQPDVPGTYVVRLVVSDPYGQSAPATVEITVLTASSYVEQQTMVAYDLVTSLPPAQVTTAGNQNALSNLLDQVAKAIQAGDTALAVDKLNQAISRTDGCERNGVPDGNGPGRDWITDCEAQASMLVYLRASLNALTQ